MKKEITADIKNDFRVLRENPEMVFLNSSATSLRPDSVMDYMHQVYTDRITSIHRGFTIPSDNTDNDGEYQDTLDAVAEHMNADYGSIIPTYGTTDFVNKLAYKLISQLEDGDEIILGKLEHAANILPWIHIAKVLNKKLVYKWYQLKDWTIDTEHMKTLVTDRTKIVAVAHVFNTVGVANDIGAVRDAIGEDAILVVDSAQGIGHKKIDVKQMKADYCFWGAHKVFGPHALGFAYIRNIDNVDQPFSFGGDMQTDFDEETITFKDGIWKFTAGTQDVPGVIAFKKAMDYLNQFGIEKVQQHCEELKAYAEEKIGSLPNVRVINEGIEASNFFFEIEGVQGKTVAYFLSQKSIIVRSGAACVKIKNENYDHNTSIRASFHVYNTKEDVDKLYDALVEGGDFSHVKVEEIDNSAICA